MKKIFTIMLMLSLSLAGHAQDVIVKKDNSAILSKVVEITKTEIKYKKWSNQDGPIYTIEISEVVSINYENGEVEEFSESSTTSNSNEQLQWTCKMRNGNMEVEGRKLKLNGIKLTKEEAQAILDPESFQQYSKASGLRLTGTIMECVGFCVVLGGIAIDLILKHSGTPNVDVVTLVSGSAICVSGYIVDLVGKRQLKSIANTYNQTHASAYSLSVAPSLLKYEMPQSANNYGLGLAISVSF